MFMIFSVFQLSLEVIFSLPTIGGQVGCDRLINCANDVGLLVMSIPV